jgi:hypothetical protein
MPDTAVMLRRHPWAQNDLGNGYLDGVWGKPQDFAEAVRWYSKAATQGHAMAQHNLGVMYDEGKGVPQDTVTAFMWFNIAGTYGYDKSREERDIAAKKLAPNQLEEAQRRAKRCMASNYQDCD